MALPRELPMHQLPTENWSGGMNMAIDAAMAESVTRRGVGYVRVYGWDPSTLSLGYSQNSTTIDWEYCASNDIEVTRRPTGGGAIYHDAVGDIAYSVVVPRDTVPSDLTKSYQLLCEPVIRVFDEVGLDVNFTNTDRNALHQPACYLRGLSPAHDLVVGDPNARKISGNAQYRTKEAVVQHGSILYSLDVEAHLGCLATATIDSTAFRERVTAIDEHVSVARSTVVSQLESILGDYFATEPETFTDEDRIRAESLCETRFGNSAWIQRGPRQEG